jgi:hypothetical protein
MNDLLLDANHDLDTSNLGLAIVRGAERVKQNILVKLRLFRGEWFLDTEAGTPYLEDVLGKRISLAGALAAIRASILEVDSVSGIANFSYTFDRKTRVLNYTFEASTPFGLIEVSL